MLVEESRHVHEEEQVRQARSDESARSRGSKTSSASKTVRVLLRPQLSVPSIRGPRLLPAICPPFFDENKSSFLAPIRLVSLPCTKWCVGVF